MTDQVPDDIFALYSRFDLDGTDCRVFLRQQTRPEPIAVEEHTKGVLADEAPELASVAARRTGEMGGRVIEKASSPSGEIRGPVHAAPATLRNSESDGSRMALHNLWQHVTPERNSSGHRTQAALASASICIHGLAGGVGSTTVTATLSRLLMKAGRRCAIVDETEDPTLPIFFGAQRIAEDHRRFSGLLSLFQPRIRILNRHMLEPLNAGADEPSSFIERHFVALGDDFDHLIFDHSSIRAYETGAGLSIYVANPDLRSVAAVQKLRHSSDPVHRNFRSICVLNRFDPASSFHNEILGWYREAFRELFVIRDSALVPEALAEGTTVVDWAPDANVSTDFLNLFTSVTLRLTCGSESLS